MKKRRTTFLDATGKRRLRKRLWQRQRGACSLCAIPLHYDDPDATFDHIIPQSQGGPSHFKNLRLAHRRCNEKRGSRLTEAERLGLRAQHFLADKARP